jgi:hypothetical protein
MRASVVRNRFRRSGAAALALGVILGMMGLLGVGTSGAVTGREFAAAAPGTYDHNAPPANATSTFGYHDGSNAYVVEQLEGGDYDCAQIVPFFTKIELGTTGSVELQYTFDRFTTGHKDGTPGVGYREIVGVWASTADPLHDAKTATLTTGTVADAAHVYATATVANLDESSVFVLRVDVRIGCDDGADPKDNTGNLLAHMDADVSGGAQTVPMKSAANIIEPPPPPTTTTTSTTVPSTTVPYVRPEVVTRTVPPTTTTLPTTTTAPPATVAPTSIVAPTTAAPAVSVLGEQLARTGGGTSVLVPLAAVCLLVGATMLLVADERFRAHISR